MDGNTGMGSWNWLNVGRVLIKAAVLFAVFNLIFASFDPWPLLAKLSVYNAIVPGRRRLPFGSDPQRSYNLTLTQLDVMVASHEIAGDERLPDEYRVLVLGDSAVWGFLLQPDETVPVRIDAADDSTADGRRIRAYNFGYPTTSLTKDLLLLSRGLEFDPDLIVWFITLESAWRENQLEAPLVQFNPEATRALILEQHLDLNPDDARFRPTSFWRRTIVGQRRELANSIRLQFYGLMWASTGVDRYIPTAETRERPELSSDLSYHGTLPGDLQENQLAFDVLSAGVALAGEVPILLINEPIYINESVEDGQYYNAAYPRWIYDAFREWLWARSEREDWSLVDLWDWLPYESFADSTVHYDAEAANALASFLAEIIFTLTAPDDG
jgi:hypothetical protein